MAGIVAIALMVVVLLIAFASLTLVITFGVAKIVDRARGRSGGTR